MTRLWKRLCAWFWRATFRPESDAELRARCLGLVRRIPTGSFDDLEYLLRSEMPATCDIQVTRKHDKNLDPGTIRVEVRHG